MSTNEIFSCRSCPKTFSERKRLTQHQKRKHLKHLRCESCPEQFGSRVDLARHVRAVHRIGQTTFRCQIGNCDVVTKRKDNLSQHVRDKHRVPHRMSQRPGSLTVQRESSINQIDGNLPASAATSECNTAEQPRWRIMMEAASTGNIVLFDQMVSTGLDINTTAEDGYTALHCAARAGKTAMVEHLLGLGAAVDSCNVKIKDRRPIHEATQTENLETIAALRKAGAKFFDRNYDIDVELLASTGNVAVVAAWFDAIPTEMNKDDLSLKLLRSAAKAGQVGLVRWVLLQNPITMPQTSDPTNLPQLSAVLREPAKPHQSLAPIIRGSSPLDANYITVISTSLAHAAKRGHTEVVEILLECKDIDVNYDSGYRYPALCSAVISGNVQVVKHFVSHPSTDVNLVGCKMPRYTALHLAVMGRNIEMVGLLLACPGIDVNKQGLWTERKHLILWQYYIEAHAKNMASVKRLLAHGDENNSVRNEEELSEKGAALDIAIELGLVEIVEMLTSRGAFTTSQLEATTSRSIAIRHHASQNYAHQRYHADTEPLNYETEKSPHGTAFFDNAWDCIVEESSS